MKRLKDWRFQFAFVYLSGIILNLIGVFLAIHFNLPVYLDTIGTVFVAVLGGYVPGIAVGFLTNLIGTLIDETEMFYGAVNIFLAVITAYFAEKGYYQKFYKTILTIAPTIFAITILAMIIEEFLSYTCYISFDSSYSGVKLWEHFMDKISIEFPDKSISVVFTFLALKFVPEETKILFTRIGKMQAPISSDIYDAIKKNGNSIWSLRTKLVFNTISLTIFTAVLVTMISYTIYHESEVRERTRIADGIISMVVNEMDPKRIDEFIAEGRRAKGYNEIESELYKIRSSNSDIKYLYVYKIMEDGCHVVFDLDTTDWQASPPGYVQPFDESFKPLLPDLFAGKPVPPQISHGTFGYLLTIYKPVYDSMGHCTCYAGIDFSMDEITENGRMFIARVITIFASAVIFIMAMALAFVENNIILPVNTMAYCAKNFAYDSEEEREDNIKRMKELDIKTHDEIENLYEAFLKTTADSMHYFENLKRVKIQVAVMDELAHKDPLTSLKNKVAYNERVAELDRTISEGTAAFAIVMIDINYLKRVNDTYGHEYGNEYLINAGRLAAKYFGVDNIYRIGGDEFAAILTGEDYERRDKAVNDIRAEIDRLATDTSLDSWKKVSAAVGVSIYQRDTDTKVEDVFKRADKDMYERKLAMKAQRTD
ncbi:MAG: diguanylate cyclase [Selenomonadaceae bacterium]|nr:diguanylate cyclase [Selenomonadaceae bacterium]